MTNKLTVSGLRKVYVTRIHKLISQRGWLMNMLRLDVGCGTNPTGDVNCDLFTSKSPHRHGKAIFPKKNIRNFVKCDVNQLPFRQKIFYESSCSHVLEHKGIDCVKVLKEMIRVTEGKIIVVVPSRFAGRSWLRHKQNVTHDKYFSVRNISNLVKKMGCKRRITVTYRYFPHSYLPLIRLPYEIKAEIRT